LKSLGLPLLESHRVKALPKPMTPFAEEPTLPKLNPHRTTRDRKILDLAPTLLSSGMHTSAPTLRTHHDATDFLSSKLVLNPGVFVGQHTEFRQSQRDRNPIL